MTQLIHELIYEAASRDPYAPALAYDGAQACYGALAMMVESVAGGLRALGAQPHDRVALYLPKREETVYVLFGAAAAGCAFVALDPAASRAQALALLADSGARFLVTSPERLADLAADLAQCPHLRTVIVCGAGGAAAAGVDVVQWEELLRTAPPAGPARPGLDDDVAALVYVGSGARPTALVLSHRNLVAAARTLQRALRIGHDDRVLAALPLACDFGLHQLTASFAAGAAAVLANPLLARDVMRAVGDERITVLAAQPALWAELAQQRWPGAAASLRIAVNAGGTLDAGTVGALRRALPRTRLILMHGQPEAFRATSLAAEEIEQRPGSIGRPLPQAGVLILRPDGSQCTAGEPGELVQRGALVAQGYWNDAPRTRDSFRFLPARAGVGLRETALWTGQTATFDEDGYVYPAQTGDEVIRTGGRRVRAGDIEDALYGSGLVQEAVALGVAHPVMGQVVAVLARARPGRALDSAQLFEACRARLPEHMLPAMVEVRRAPLPRDRLGHVDRALLAAELAPLFAEVTP
jgi:acyl-CoA synthetase (AMP-forming)/AMP-acid ligase II